MSLDTVSVSACSVFSCKCSCQQEKSLKGEAEAGCSWMAHPEKATGTVKKSKYSPVAVSPNSTSSN